MRRLNWVHRDLKPGNLLLSRESLQEAAAAEGGLKIGDFGFARDLAPEGLAETWVRAPARGLRRACAATDTLLRRGCVPGEGWRFRA